MFWRLIFESDLLKAKLFFPIIPADGAAEQWCETPDTSLI